MAERLAYLEAVIGADITQFRKAMRDVRNDVGILSETIGGLGKLGRTATFAISAPLATLGSFAVQAASDFDASMRNINSIAMMGENQFKDLSAAVLEFGSTTRGGAVEAADALYTVFSAGITGTADAMEIMEVATMTAEAGLADMTTTTESLVASILGFGQANMTATRASDSLTQMVQIGVGSMQQFAGATAKVIPTANTLGIEIEELFASLAFLTQRGNNAAVASTQVRSALTALMKPTEGMEKAFKSLGVNGAEELIQDFGGLQGAFQALVDTTDGSSKEISKLFANIRGKAFVDAITGDPAVFKAAIDEFVETVEGATGRAHAEQMKSFAAQWDLMTSAVGAASIAIGQVLLPVLLPVVNAITSMFLEIQNVNPAILQMAVAFASVVTVAAPLLWLFSTLLNPIGLLLGGIVALGVAFTSHMDGMIASAEGLANVFPTLGSAFDDLMGLFGDDGLDPSQLIPETPLAVKATDLWNVEQGDNLWTIWDLNYKSKGWTQDEFYDEFKRLNGVMTLDLWEGDVITLPNSNRAEELVGSVIGTAADFDKAGEAYIDSLNVQKLFDMVGGEMVSGGQELPFEAQLGMSLRRIQRKLPAILGEIGTEVASWVDTNAGAGINFIASLFEGTEATGGRTPVYRAIQSLMEGDFTGALNDLVPELGDDVSGFFESVFAVDLNEIFPTISAALGTLVTNIGEWFLNDGIPTLARSIGFFAGKIATLIFDGLKMIGEFFSGGGAGDVASGIGTYVEDSVAKPMSEGFDDAMSGSNLEGAVTGLTEGITSAIEQGLVDAETGLTTAKDGIVSAIEDIRTEVSTALDTAKAWLDTAVANVTAVLDLLEFDKLVEGLVAIGEGVISFGTSLAGADWSGIVKLTGALVAIANVVGGEFLRIAGTMLADFGEGIASFVNGVADIMNGDTGAGIADFIAAIVDVGFAFLAFPVAIIDGIIDVVNQLFNFDIGSLSGLMQSVQDEIDRITFEPTGVEVGSFEWSMGAGFDASAKAMMESMDESIIMALSDMQIDLDADTLRMQIAMSGADMVLQGMSPEDAILRLMNDWDGVINEPMLISLTELLFSIEDGAIPTGTDDVATTVSDAVGTLIEDMPPIAPTLFDDEAIAIASTDAGISAGEALTSSMADSILNGEMSPETFLTDFLQPFNTNWSATFGAEGVIQTELVSTTLAFSTAMAGLTVSALGASVGVVVAMSGMAGGLAGSMSVVNSVMKEAKGNVDQFLKSIRALASIATNLQIKVEVSGNVNAPEPDGTHRTGLANVPFDGYLAQLHKGEGVLTEDENKAYNSMGSIPSTATGLGGGGNTTNNSNSQYTVIVDGSVGVDELLEELERRGWDLDG